MGCSTSKRTAVVQPVAVEVGGLHDDYDLGRLLGTGSFGTVFHAKRHGSGEECAVKVVTFADCCLTLQDFRSEQRAWARVGEHPNIVSLLDWYVDGKFGYFVMELCHSSLLQAWSAEQELNEHTYAKYFADMAMGLHHIHSLRLVHGDVKHDNFLVDMRTDRKVKLCDFGFACMLHDCRNLARQCGTAPYMAPEAVTPLETRGTASDVWSFGVIVYMCFYGRWPYSTRVNNSDAFKRAIRFGTKMPTFRPRRKFRQGAVSDVALDFARALLSRDVNERPSAADCLNMDYLVQQGARAMERGISDLSSISLRPLLRGALKCRVFNNLDPQGKSHVITAVREMQSMAQVRQAATSASGWGRSKKKQRKRSTKEDLRPDANGQRASGRTSGSTETSGRVPGRTCTGSSGRTSGRTSTGTSQRLRPTGQPLYVSEPAMRIKPLLTEDSGFSAIVPHSSSSISLHPCIVLHPCPAA